MSPKMIVIDGKIYNSVEEMPPDVRRKYEQAMQTLGDANNNQIPDVFETMNIFADKDRDGVADVLENLTAAHASVNRMKIIVDGKEFDGLENLPPEVRATYEQAMGKIDSDRNGIPDSLEEMIHTSNQNVMASSTVADTPPPSTSLPISPTITPETTNGWMLVVSGLFIFFLCAAGMSAVWYFFLR